MSKRLVERSVGGSFQGLLPGDTARPRCSPLLPTSIRLRPCVRSYMASHGQVQGGEGPQRKWSYTGQDLGDRSPQSSSSDCSRIRCFQQHLVCIWGECSISSLLTTQLSFTGTRLMISPFLNGC